MRTLEAEPPVPIGLEPALNYSTTDRVLGRAPEQGPDKFPSSYGIDYRNGSHPEVIGCFPSNRVKDRLSRNSEDFPTRYPALAEYDRRVVSGDREQEDYARLLKDYVKTLNPKEHQQIAGAFAQYNHELLFPASEGCFGHRRPPEPGPHLRAYLEQVQELKQAAHASEQARRQHIAAELGPEFRREVEQWKSQNLRDWLLL